MDAYNRGYNAGLNQLSDATNTQIGNAFIYDTDGDTTAQSASFYAIAYTLSGETIISYRGTDDASDIWNGWTTGVGNANSHSARA